MEIYRAEANHVQGVIEPANIISDKTRVTVNWSAIGAVSVPEAEKFALDVLRVCAEIRIQASKNDINI